MATGRTWQQRTKKNAPPISSGLNSAEGTALLARETMRDMSRISRRPCRVVMCVALARILSCPGATAFAPVLPTVRNPLSFHFDRATSKNDPDFVSRNTANFVARASPEMPKPSRKAKKANAKKTAAINMNFNLKSRARSRTKMSSGAHYQRKEMLNHDILTRDEELALGTKIVRAKELKEAMVKVIEEKKTALLGGFAEDDQTHRDLLMGDAAGNEYLSESGFDGDDMHHISVHRLDPTEGQHDGYPRIDVEFMSASYKKKTRTGYKKNSKLIADPDDRLLSDEDIVLKLDIPGGRSELQQILLDGVVARETLIRDNVRLVVSIAKKWAKQTAKHTKSEGTLANLYAGSWTRPSLDEAIQEGILGLTRAAELYDPSRGLRFSTYCTHWVTSYVRQCFHTAMTGCFKVPAKLHHIKSQYNRILKRCYSTDEEIPSEEAIAEELGITVSRLKTALRATQTLLSIDAPISPGPGGGTGSRAGGDGIGGVEILLSDTLQCGEARPDDLVELSFLRQCLENAMAMELSPYERDVLRLRLGLDDGITRTVRQVVEVCGGAVSASDVRAAEKRAFKKLRSPSAVHTYKLLAYLDFAGIDSQHSVPVR